MPSTASISTALQPSEAELKVKALRDYFHSHATRPYQWRMSQLGQVIKLLDEKETELMDALMKDSGKAEFTAYSGDIAFVHAEAKYAMKRLKKWMKPEKVGTPMMLKPAKSYIRSEPLGVVLVMGAWNFPAQLTLGAMVGALAAGNTVLIKPSEVSPRVAAFLSKYVPQYFDTQAVKVMEGGVEETTDILTQRFDKILYTGNSFVGKIVMAAAAKHLTPVTLELGGKNPVIVDASAKLEVAANRIIDSKFTNAGQICVAADYLLVHEAVYDQFLPLLKAKITEFFGEYPKDSNAYSRIINERHVQRIKQLMQGCSVYAGGVIEEADNYISPTLLVDVPLDAPIMGDEIFGPLLPIFKYSNEAEAVDFVNRNEKPLAFYIFTEDRLLAERILNSTNSGAAGINAIMMHASNPELPFGGVGNSGMDAYHGKFSFDNMSHKRSVLDKSTRIDPRGMYPPFTEKDVSMRKKITKWLL
jgi:aldehyde dehydrogenase (NAD+)